MNRGDFDQVIEMAVGAIETGCPTFMVGGKLCAGCGLAAARVRRLEPPTPPVDVIAEVHGHPGVPCWKGCTES